jgi:hypothetical protein
LAVSVTEEAASFARSTACEAVCVAVPATCPAVSVTKEAASLAESASVLVAADADSADATVDSSAADEVDALADVTFIEDVWAATADSTEAPPRVDAVLGSSAALLVPAVEAALDGTGVPVRATAPSASSDAVV